MHMYKFCRHCSRDCGLAMWIGVAICLFCQLLIYVLVILQCSVVWHKASHRLICKIDGFRYVRLCEICFITQPPSFIYEKYTH